VDASRFAVTVEADRIRGEWTDPRLAKTSVAEWSERWLRTKASLKPKTLAGYESHLHAHVLPAFGSHELRHLDRMAVEEWVADLQASGLGPSAVRQARQVLNSMMKLAVEAGYLLANPVTGVKVARQPDREMLFLSAGEVERLAATMRRPYGTLVYLLAYGGLRWGEATAIRRKRCDLLRSRIEVAESLSEVHGTLHFGPTKTYRRRMVNLPGSSVISSQSISLETWTRGRTHWCSPRRKGGLSATPTSAARPGTRPLPTPGYPTGSGFTT